MTVNEEVKQPTGHVYSPTELLRNMALSDALSMQRTLTALREAALSEVVKKIPGMNPDKMLEVLQTIDSTNFLDSYAKLIDKIGTK